MTSRTQFLDSEQLECSRPTFHVLEVRMNRADQEQAINFHTQVFLLRGAARRLERLARGLPYVSR